MYRIYFTDYQMFSQNGFNTIELVKSHILIAGRSAEVYFQNKLILKWTREKGFTEAKEHFFFA